MFTNQPVHESSSSLRTVISAATTGLVERESLVEMVALSAVAEEHVLVIGRPEPQRVKLSEELHAQPVAGTLSICWVASLDPARFLVQSIFIN